MVSRTERRNERSTHFYVGKSKTDQKVRRGETHDQTQRPEAVSRAHPPRSVEGLTLGRKDNVEKAAKKAEKEKAADERKQV